ncbi:MAG: acc operon protein [Halobacteriaceae archaeon]
METSRFDIPDRATADETAAIIAAITSHLATVRAESEEQDQQYWSGNRWSYQGRIEQLQSRTTRVPTYAPKNKWKSAGRTDRF